MMHHRELWRAHSCNAQKHEKNSYPLRLWNALQYDAHMLTSHVNLGILPTNTVQFKVDYKLEIAKR